MVLSQQVCANLLHGPENEYACCIESAISYVRNEELIYMHICLNFCKETLEG